MYKLLFLIFLPLALASCASDTSSFARMSIAELADYNRSVAYPDKIICIDEVRLGTHINRRYCETIAQMQSRKAAATGKLNASNLGTASVFTAN